VFSASASGACRALDAQAGPHPKSIMVRVGLGRLSMQLITATCEDGVIRHQEASRIRVRIEEVAQPLSLDAPRELI